MEAELKSKVIGQDEAVIGRVQLLDIGGQGIVGIGGDLVEALAGQFDDRVAAVDHVDVVALAADQQVGAPLVLERGRDQLVVAVAALHDRGAEPVVEKHIVAGQAAQLHAGAAQGVGRGVAGGEGQCADHHQVLDIDRRDPATGLGHGGQVQFDRIDARIGGLGDGVGGIDDVEVVARQALGAVIGRAERVQGVGAGRSDQHAHVRSSEARGAHSVFGRSANIGVSPCILKMILSGNARR